MKVSLERLNNIFEQAEEKKSENMKIGQLRLSSLKKRKKNDQSLRGLWVTIKCANICIMGVPEEIKKEQKEYLKNNGWKYPKFDLKLNLHIKEAQQTPEE